MLARCDFAGGQESRCKCAFLPAASEARWAPPGAPTHVQNDLASVGFLTATDSTGSRRAQTFAIALTAAALPTGTAMAQTVNDAPQNSPGVQNQVKQAPRTGDASQVGGTPSANMKGNKARCRIEESEPHLADSPRNLRKGVVELILPRALNM